MLKIALVATSIVFLAGAAPAPLTVVDLEIKGEDISKA